MFFRFISFLKLKLPILGRKLIEKPKVLLALLLISFFIVLYVFLQYQRSQSELTKLKVNPKEIALAETQKLVREVSNLMELPQKETPTLATVTDINKLKTQPFFVNAKNGDKVLIYSLSKKAILYRPSVKKIIEAMPVNIGETQTTETPKLQLEKAETSIKPDQLATEKTVKVVLYNGTKIVGLTYSTENKIKEKIKNIDVIDKDNAKKDDYDKTIIINFGSGNQDVVQKLAQELKGEAGQLPDGEIKPENADILVILGLEQ